MYRQFTEITDYTKRDILNSRVIYWEGFGKDVTKLESHLDPYRPWRRPLSYRIIETLDKGDFTPEQEVAFLRMHMPYFYYCRPQSKYRKNWEYIAEFIGEPLKDVESTENDDRLYYQINKILEYIADEILNLKPQEKSRKEIKEGLKALSRRLNYFLVDHLELSERAIKEYKFVSGNKDSIKNVYLTETSV